jgi:tRNA(Met) C34 N-acetyltransferase TmcA
MLRPLSAAGQEIYAEARQRFSVRFALLLKDVLSKLDQPLRNALIADLPSVKALPDAHHELLAYAYARRGFEVSLYAIQQWVQDYFDRSSLNHLSSQQLKLLRLRVQEHLGWKDVVSSLKLSGKREAQELMRETVAQMIDQTGNEEMFEYRNTLKRLAE